VYRVGGAMDPPMMRVDVLLPVWLVMVVLLWPLRRDGVELHLTTVTNKKVKGRRRKKRRIDCIIYHMSIGMS